jgi:hypothetical protein
MPGRLMICAKRPATTMMQVRQLTPQSTPSPAKGVSRSTLADANETRDWRIFADLARMLTAAARPLYAGDPLGVELEETAYALDCTTISG